MILVNTVPQLDIYGRSQARILQYPNSRQLTLYSFSKYLVGGL